MLDRRQFYINGHWINPLEPNDLEVINPATEQPIAVISMGTAADIDLAVAAAKQAFAAYSRTSVEERLALLEKLLAVYKRRYHEMAHTIMLELGAPITISTEQQADVGVGHPQGFIDALKRLTSREPCQTATYSGPSRSASAASSRLGTGRSTRSRSRSYQRLRRVAPAC